jgi:hypothetical protein
MSKVIDMSVWNACSENVSELSDAMAKAFGQLQNVVRNKVSHFAKKGKDGKPVPDYADLASCFDCIRTAYSTNGLSVSQTFHPYGEDGTIHLVTTVRHSSGQFERSYLPMPGRIPPQELAKTATYLKRIALCAIAGIAADDDDDGEQAEKSAASAAVNDEARIEKALAAKIRAAQDAETIAAVMDQVARGVSSSQLSDAAATRLRLVGGDAATKLAKKKPEAEKKQPAMAS